MDQETIFLTIVGMAVVTFIPRLLPVLLLSSRTLPPVIIRWLSYIPVAVLSAMLLPTILVVDGKVALKGDNILLWAAIPTLVVAVETKSLFTSVVAGMIMVAAARYFLGF